MAENEPDFMATLKALADESRLQLIRILHQQETSVGDLARQLELSEPTVSHHLARLREAGLVNLRMDGTQRFYRLNSAGLNRFKQAVNTLEQTPQAPPAADSSWIERLGWSGEDAQILKDHTDGPRLTKLPAKRKKTTVIMRWLATLFEEGRNYSESEVNEVLMEVYKTDYVSLRRDLVDYGILKRKAGGSKYWLNKAG